MDSKDSKDCILTLSDCSTTCAPRTEPSETDLQAQPWKYLGYKAFSEWSASDNDFFVLRRFSTLNTRVMLKMQDEIVRLEELAEIDRTNAQLHHPPTNNGSFRNDVIPMSQNIRNCEHALQLNPTKEPTSRTGYFIAIPAPYFLPKRIILVTICGWLKRHLKTMLLGSDPETTYYYDGQLIESIIRCSMILLGLAMLIAPLWWLLLVETPAYRLGIISGFTTLFLALVTAISGAGPFETLASTAAYSAVLMVYMQSAGI
ncbi:hypothetical protein FE257_003664 [Aspergillus nanangensis]|uniref:DUF6594 domain-containing protein n=1 Tax=Aspergillus nanangensis TaxID=2582783 RepID=A0AAD4CSH2_ASPNN|nr:hypothetical protein FE257_003664 [Aspergillus nanangensis]